LGTPAYMAPELITGREARPPADVYSLGIMLFELLAGRRPFHEPNTAALQRAHLEQAPVRPAGLPEPLWHLVAACLDKEPARRPTPGQVADGLRRHDALVDDNPPPDADERAPMATGWVPRMPAPVVSAPVVSAPVVSAPGAAGQAAILPTEAPTRPPLAAPPSPPSPPSRRWRRWPMVAAVLTTVVLGLAIGFWWARAAGSPPAPPRAESQTGYSIPVSATVGSNGQVVLSWSTGAERMTGFEGYLVLRDNRPVRSSLLPPAETTFVDPAARSGSCYQVIAVGVPETPPAPPPPPCPTFGQPEELRMPGQGQQ
ncbi:MAG: serine/threonine-protein kinase, partial [Pseudonocardiaceae bacterium]